MNAKQPVMANPAPEQTKASAHCAKIVIEPPNGRIRINWREIWECRELVGFFVWRDLKVKYRQTMLGVAWAILVPLLQMVVFTVIFGKIAGFSTDGLPKPLFYFSAMIPWTYFATSLAASSNALVSNASFLTKIYFPRLIIPISPCISNLLDFAIVFMMLLLMMGIYHIVPPVTTLLVPVFMLIGLGTATAMGLLFSSLTVRYRDLRHIIPFIIQIWMYCSVIIPYSTISTKLGKWSLLYNMNPMVGVIEGFRWCLFRSHLVNLVMVGGEPVRVPVNPPWHLLATGVPVMLVLLTIGLFYFRRMEETFADVI